MKWQKKHTTAIGTVLTAVVALIILLISTCETEATELNLIVGAQYNDVGLAPLIGASITLSPKISAFATTSWDELQHDYQLRGAYTLQPFPGATLAVLLGPQITVWQPEPTLDLTLTYILTSTGMAFAYQINPRIGVFIAYDRLITGKDLPTDIIGIGAYFQLGDL